MKSNTATHFCKLCFKDIEPNSVISFFGDEVTLCRKCYFSLSPDIRVARMMDGTRLITLYRYEEGFRSALFQFKGCGDIELSSIFLSRLAPFLRVIFRHHVLVPAPSSDGHNAKRGFNHVEEICRSLSLPVMNVLRKTKEHKQSDLSKQERLKVSRVLAVTNGEKIRGKKVLFVDDVFTTGSTAKACIALLKKAGASRVDALILAKVKLTEEESEK